MNPSTIANNKNSDAAIGEMPQSVTTPVPMSFPAILRNERLADRFAYLREGTEAPSARDRSGTISLRKGSRDDKEGKRWVRRRENAHFTNNPHIVQASTRDVQIDPPSVRRTFPEPLPRYLPRSVSAPAASQPTFDAASANMGRYSLSLKGMRRTLRGHGPRAQALVHEIEKEVMDWLAGTAIVLPDETEDVLMIHGRPIGSTLTVTELTRTPLQLIWSIEQDAFARYIVHCCARYHKVVSYSKDVDGRRLTYLLRPNVTRTDYSTRNTLDTPPATESDSSLGVLSESDILSVDDNESVTDSPTDSEIPTRNVRRRRLSSVSEKDSEAEVDDTPRPLRIRQASDLEDLNEFADDDNDSVVNGDLAQSVDSLDLNYTTSRNPPIRYTSPLVERTPLRDRRGISRTSSSPSHSRSPRPPSRHRRNRRNRLARSFHDPKQSFYEYLYS